MPMNKAHRFDGKVAIVTGAGEGLGRQHALELASRGAKLVVNDIGKTADGQSSAESTACALKKSGAEAVADTGNIADEANVEALIQRAVDTFGRIDILINNAGNGVAAPIWKISTDDFNSVLNVHLYGTFWAMRAALRHMRRHGYGRIVNTASALGAFGAPHSAPYVTAKAGIIGLSKAAALDNVDMDIRVNAIAPVANTTLAKSFFASHPELKTEKLTPTRVSPVVLYLCHESCTLNGELISVAAGRVARIFMATAPGFYSDALTSEQVASNLERVMDPADYIVPTKSMDQYQFLKL
jgi:NAD(P)-dependent dehydrogenase (short-subunit alcohol dehydrogenase family)